MQVYANVLVGRRLPEDVGPFEMPEAAVALAPMQRTPGLLQFRIDVWANGVAEGRHVMAPGSGVRAERVNQLFAVEMGDRIASMPIGPSGARG